ncbi:isochorismate synthase [Planomonospora parontospora]|uniref:isochorismate synthase n=1 Tax=Planomonospora parontospora TaxID=58119 RepID=UPI0016700873|nr:isochorismate synthase [Planomonospora parontospora]GGL41075.1 isochorismate synthase DhbC [Planomonospora parontospora subsp. antibiotica]GII17923.1 isochorismate synthase DhbC [Planomonospora parontospora subsp. antibiotica]
MAPSTLSTRRRLAPPAAAPAAAPTLTGYRPGTSVLFTAPGQTLLTQGHRDLITAPLPDLPDRVATALADAPAGSLATGAITFDGATSHLIVPEHVTWSGPFPSVRTRRSPAAWTITPVPTAEHYLTSVQRALDLITGGSLDKVVLARALDLHADQPIDVRDLLARLTGRGRHVFAVPLPDQRTLLGASPELLISRHGRQITTMPLAGSAARSTDPLTDRQRAQQLQRSVKDRHEHRLVIDAIADALQPYCTYLHVPYEPTLLPTPTMWHLATTITGRLRDEVPSLTLAAALHPTPAICGTPTAAARTALTDLELLDRGFYGGLVGWTDATGDGEWALTIRCAETRGRTLRLWAGAGIVTGSDPEHELAETSAKFRTLLQGLGVTAFV